jgi:hypothetical protein
MPNFRLCPQSQHKRIIVVSNGKWPIAVLDLDSPKIDMSAQHLFFEFAI